jgi:hypothetical protein
VQWSRHGCRGILPGVGAITQIGWTPSALRLELADGRRVELASVWLRDNLREDRDPRSGQRLIDVADLPAAPRIRHAVLQGEAVRIEWEQEAGSAFFDLHWLAAQASAIAGARPQPRPRLWLEEGRLDAARDFAWAALDRVRGEAGVQGCYLTRDSVFSRAALLAEDR